MSMNDILDFEMRISSSMDRILKVLEKPKFTNYGDANESDEISHLEKIIAQLEEEKKETTLKLQSTLEAISSANQKVEQLSDSIEKERVAHTNQIEENNKIIVEIESLKNSRQSQLDEMDSILADLEPLLEKTGEVNA